jgi:hypothetical protein
MVNFDGRGLERVAQLLDVCDAFAHGASLKVATAPFTM